MQINVEKIKRILAVVIMSCLFLPLAQCSQKENLDQRKNSAHQHVAVKAEPSAYVPMQVVSLSEISSCLVVAVFAWPLCAAICRWRARKRSVLTLINLGELIFAMLSLAYLALVFSTWKEILFAGAMAVAAFCLHLALSAYVLIVYARRNRTSETLSGS